MLGSTGDIPIQDRVLALRAEITRHDRLYYTQAKTEISDTEYDALLRELSDLEAQHPELLTADSPTQRVAGAPIDGFETVEHALPMLSIDNTYNRDELGKWIDRTAKGLGLEPVDEEAARGLFGGDQHMPILCEPKVDGVALSLRYEQGQLIRAVTRGDGKRGDDITPNARRIGDIPLKLKGDSLPSVLEVRGEVYMPNPVFRKLNEQREEAGLERFANPRNSTAGQLKQKDASKVARGLRFFAHGRGETQGLDLPSHHAFLHELKQWGLTVNNEIRLVDGVDEAWAYIERFDHRRRELEYQTDGVVLKLDRYAQQAQLGHTSKAPRWCIAYKFAAEQATTKLIDVEWMVGKTGKLTPRATMEPVELAGTTVRHANLHNFGEILRKDIRLGDTVVVEKAGEIIPQVIASLAADRRGSETPIEAPAFCPACGTPVVLEMNQKRIDDIQKWVYRLRKAAKDAKRTGEPIKPVTKPKPLSAMDESGRYCVNSNCSGQMRDRLKWFVRRGQMDIDGLGDSLIDELIDEGLVSGLADIYRLHEHQSELLARKGFKSRKVNRLLAGIEASKQRGLAKLLGSLGVAHIGVGTADLVVDRFATIDELAAADKAKLMSIEGVGEVAAVSLFNFLRATPNRLLLDELKSFGVKLSRSEVNLPPPADAQGYPVEGVKLVVTGTFSSLSRTDLERRLKSMGAKVTKSVTGSTKLLLVGDKPGSKLDKAKELGVEIWSEQELLEKLPNIND